jgi:hypothetical protein
MSTLDRMLDALPPIYAIDDGSVLHQFLDSLALELDAYAEDLDRLRRTHWFAEAYRLTDLEKIAALVGIIRRSWEPLEMFRERVRALVDARLAGSVGPTAVRTYVYEAVRGAEQGLDATLVPGLEQRAVPSPGDPFAVRANPAALAAAFGVEESHPAWRPLQLVENPPRLLRSAALAARGGLVGYLHRWSDVNSGMAAAPVTVTITGRSGGHTATPVIANLTTGQALVYAGVLRVGQRLTVSPSPDQGVDARRARAVIDDVHDVTDRVLSLSGFRLGTPFSQFDGDDPGPLLPVQERGPNAWIYISAGLFDVRGLDDTYFQLAGEDLRQGAFDGTAFDQAIFATRIAARLELSWSEREPAAFSVVIPHGIVALPTVPDQPQEGGLGTEIAEGLAGDLDDLRAAGVRSRLELRPFGETQRQVSRVTLPWLVVPPEIGPAGEAVRVAVGGRFGESRFGEARFE